MSEKEAHYYRLYAEEERAKVDRVRAAIRTGRAEALHWFDQGGDSIFRGRLQAYEEILDALDEDQS